MGAVSARISESIDGITIGTVLDSLDPLLAYRGGPADRQRPVTAVGVLDPLDPAAFDLGSLVLGIGIDGTDRDGHVELVARLADDAVSALAVREPLEPDAPLLAACEASGLTVLGVASGAAWAHLVALLGALLSSAEGAASARADGLDLDDGADLFSIANALAAQFESPVTIESPALQILAFSTNQLHTDEARRETILGRRVPERFAALLREIGFLQQLRVSTRPLFLPSLEPGVAPRMAMPVRAGDSFLGSIWTMVDAEPDDRYEQRMIEAAGLVALRMLRARELATVAARHRVRLMTSLLEGGPGARHAAGQHGLPNRLTGMFAAEVRGWSSDDSAGHDAALHRIGAALGLHAGAVHARAVSAVVGHTAFAVIPLAGDRQRAERRLRSIAGEFVAASERTVPVRVALGGVVADVALLDGARRDAEAVLRVLASDAGQRHRPLASAAELQATLILHDLADRVAASGIEVAGPLATLIDYDRTTRSELVPSLRAWFDAFGDIATAAAALGVHPNTLRYRLRRVGEVSGLDLGDADARLGTMLQLRLFV